VSVNSDIKPANLSNRISARISRSLEAIADAIERRPLRAFAGFLALHFAVWTILPALLYPNLRLDLIEALIYGREWQLGYDKLPPLPWWLVEIVWRVFHADIALYALSQLVVVGSFAVIYVLARKFMPPVAGLVAVLFLDGLHFFHEASTQFNHNVVILPFWALAGLSLHAALRASNAREANGPRVTPISANLNWALFGFSLAAGLWSKYFIVVLIAPCALFLLVDRDARKSLATPGPWIAVAVALVVASPHLLWLFQHDFQPFAYADGRSDPRRGWTDHLWHPLLFAAIQFAFLLPSFFIVGPLLRTRWRDRAEGNAPIAAPCFPLAVFSYDAFDRRILAWLTFGPFVTVMLMSAVSGRGAQPMWGYPIWLFLGVFIVAECGRAIAGRLLGEIAALWATVFLIFTAAFAIDNSGLRVTRENYRATLFPGKILADDLTAKFKAATGRDAAYVIGPAWEGGNVAHYAPSRPRLLLDADPARAPWIDLADLKAKGAIVVWGDPTPARLPDEYHNIAGGATLGPPIVLRLHRLGTEYAVGWGILRPEPTR
jgi:hypothetical protein